MIDSRDPPGFIQRVETVGALMDSSSVSPSVFGIVPFHSWPSLNLVSVQDGGRRTETVCGKMYLPAARAWTETRLGIHVVPFHCTRVAQPCNDPRHFQRCGCAATASTSCASPTAAAHESHCTVAIARMSRGRRRVTEIDFDPVCDVQDLSNGCMHFMRLGDSRRSPRWNVFIICDG